MIIDTFMFNDEFEMLDIRLDISNKYVDKWIILEGNKTWSGNKKPYHLQAKLDYYSKKYKDRIQVIQLEIPEGYTEWKCENFSRASLQKGIDLHSDDDIIIHSDLDEVLNPELFPSIVDLLDKENKPVNCTLDMFIYHFNRKMYRTWSGNIVARKRMFKNPQELYKGDQYKKKNRSHCVRYPDIAGWHWTWIGNDDRIRNKVQSVIEHQGRNPDEVLNALKNNDTKTAINHKCDSFVLDYPYPKSVTDIISKYPYWFKQT
jgi:hypothetical protein